MRTTSIQVRKSQSVDIRFTVRICHSDASALRVRIKAQMAFGHRQTREPISVQVYNTIRHRILDLTFEPGALLSETRLSAELGFSRTPVREAFKRLENEGLLDVIPQHGTYVAPIRRGLVMDAQFARSALECAVVRLAAERRTPAAMLELDANFSQQKSAAAAEDFENLFRLDEEMHQIIANASGRPMIWQLIAEIKVHMDRARKLTLNPTHAPTLIAQHGAIIEAVRQSDPNAAAKAMAQHLEFLVEHFDEFMAAAPKYGQDVKPDFA
jgi:GntR family transcriptional regulator, rspAB operon transcriptional repressor